MKILIGVITFVVLQIIFFLVFLWATYKDETITVGNAFGFIIGQEKKDVYATAYKNLMTLESGLTKIFIMSKVDKNVSAFTAINEDMKIMTQTYLQEPGFERFEMLDKWRFYINASTKNIFELEFENGKLVKIYRHKRHFDLP